VTIIETNLSVLTYIKINIKNFYLKELPFIKLKFICYNNFINVYINFKFNMFLMHIYLYNFFILLYLNLKPEKLLIE